MRKITTLVILLLIHYGLEAQYTKDTLVQSAPEAFFLKSREFTALDLINREAHHVPLVDLKKRKTVTVHSSICLPDILSPAVIRIRDGQDAAVLPGATVRFISSDGSDTLMYVADSAGQVSRKDLKKGVVYNIYVTATGYKAFTGSVHSIGDGIIQLEREYIIGQEVILSSGLVHRCGRGCGGNLQRRSKECSIQKKQICNASTEVLTEQLEKNSLHIYPNPVRKGQPISVKLAQGYFTSGSIRIHSIDGKQLLSVPVSGSQKTGMIQIFMQQGWPPGLYILQLVYANGRVGASEIVIIQ